MKKRTMIDRIRDAIRAFLGKQIGSVTFGVDVKKCSECDKYEHVFYICDRQKCPRCSYPECKHTADVKHAKNFQYGFQSEAFWEIDTITEEDAMKFFEEESTDG